MGIVRRHPFITSIVIAGSVPLLGLAALEIAQERAACRRWRFEVESTVIRRSGVERPPPVSGTVEGVPFEELREGMRDQAAHELRATRPALCFP